MQGNLDHALTLRINFIVVKIQNPSALNNATQSQPYPHLSIYKFRIASFPAQSHLFKGGIGLGTKTRLVKDTLVQSIYVCRISTRIIYSLQAPLSRFPVQLTVSMAMMSSVILCFYFLSISALVIYRLLYLLPPFYWVIGSWVSVISVHYMHVDEQRQL